MEQIKLSEFTREELKNFIIGSCVLGVSLLITLIVKLDRNTWKGAEDTDYSVYTFYREYTRTGSGQSFPNRRKKRDATQPFYQGPIQ